MNWQLIAAMFLVLFIIVVIAGTLIYYIRHWANRAQAAQASLSGHEGSYFVRYVPPGSRLLEQEGQQQSAYARSPKLLAYLLSGVVVFGMTGVLATTTYLNRDKLASTIDLTDEELKQLKIQEHTWRVQETQKLPVLADQLAYFKNKGVILVFSGGSEPWPQNGKSLTNKAKDQWNDFADLHGLEVVDCAWGELKECRAGKENWLHVILPGHWYKDSIDSLLNHGSKVIAYGPPQQIFSDPGSRYSLGNLDFVSTTTPNVSDLSLVGDQELTLGFDAGLILEVKPAVADFRATTTHPQAINIADGHDAGGNIATRLFAQTQEKGGRLVWMDFSPNATDHADELNQHFFQAVIASIFRYLGGVPYSAWANWPEGSPFAALMEEDTEDKFQNAERVALFFKENNYPITWYMLSNDAQQNRDLTRLLASTGEVACHGDNHQSFARNDIQTQHIRLARCKKVIEEITGKPVLTFRPPEERHNADTLSAIANNGMTHFIAENSSDRFTPKVYVATGSQQTLVSIPRMNSDDFAMWHDFRLADRPSINLLKHETDWIKQVGGLLMFSFHSQYMGNDRYFNTIKELANHINDSKAYFATAGDIANWWRVRASLLGDHPVSAAEIEKYQPTYLTVGSDGVLSRQAISTSNKLALVSQKESQ